MLLRDSLFLSHIIACHLQARAPSAVEAILQQIDWSAVPEAQIPGIATSLLQLTPGTGDAPARLLVKLAVVLQGLAQMGAAGTAAPALDALLQLVLAAAKGVPAAGVGALLGQPGQGRPCALASADLAALATCIFSPVEAPAAAGVCVQLLEAIDWPLIRRQAPPALALRWLLAPLAAARALTAVSDEQEGRIAARLRRVVDIVVCSQEDEGTCLCRLDTPAAVEEAHLLCMLEVGAGVGAGAVVASAGHTWPHSRTDSAGMPQAPGGQLRSVAAVWHQLQLSLTLEVCRFWLAGAAPGQDVASSVAGLLEVSRLPHHAERLAELGRGAAVVEALSSFIRATAARDVDPAWATLARCLNAAVASGAEAESPAYAAVAASVTEALAAGCPRLPAAPSPPTAMDLLAELEPPGTLAAAPEAPALTDEVDPGASMEAYRRLCTWLGLLTAHLAEGSSPPDLLLELVGRLAQAAHYLPAGAEGPEVGAEERAGILVAALLRVVRLLPERRLAAVQERLLAVRRPAGSAAGWLPVLGCWLADVAAIRDLAPGPGSEGALAALHAAWQAAAASEPSDLAAEVALMVHEAAVQAGDGPHAAALWLEFGLRLRRHQAALQPLFVRDELLGQLSSVGQRYYRDGGRLTAALTRVAALVGGEAGAEGDSVGLVLPLEDAAAAQELASIDQTWLGAIKELQTSMPIRSLALEPALATLPAPQPPVDDSFLETLQARQAQQAEALGEAAALLKLWGRRLAVRGLILSPAVCTGHHESTSPILACRAEKKAAPPEGGTELPEGREGDVPEVLSEAQAKLWEAIQQWDDGLCSLQTELRHLICTRYKPVDMAQLRASVDEYEEGQRVPPQHNDVKDGKRYAELRQSALALVSELATGERVAASILDDTATPKILFANFTHLFLLLTAKQFAEAASRLFAIEHVLKHVPVAAGSEILKPQLVMTLAEAALDGSSPAVASPYLARLFEEAVSSGMVSLDTEAKVRLRAGSRFWWACVSQFVCRAKVSLPPLAALHRCAWSRASRGRRPAAGPPCACRRRCGCSARL